MNREIVRDFRSLPSGLPEREVPAISVSDGSIIAHADYITSKGSLPGANDEYHLIKTKTAQKTVETAQAVKRGVARCETSSPMRAPQIALITPYSGNNFGDAAIQDAMIANLRLRLPDAQFSGISLNSDNYLRLHGVKAFPLCATGNAFYAMSAAGRVSNEQAATQTAPRYGLKASLKAAVRRVPGARWLIKMVKPTLKTLRAELRHCVDGYHFLENYDLVIVCGGGQLDEEWGGVWGHPFSLFKWAALSKFAGVPYVVVSVGACKATSKASRFFLSAALRMARYRSYRDKNSHEIAAGLFARAAKDSVVPDLAFSLPSSELPQPAELRTRAQGRTIVAISPIVYSKPGAWPSANQDLYDRYLEQMTALISQFLRRGYFLVLVWSALSDEPVVAELLARLDENSKILLTRQAYFPRLTSWKDLLAVLQDADFLVASRLHSTIFGFLAQTPLVAISFDPKVDWAMQDLGQVDSLLQIRNFTANDVMQAVAHLELRKKEIAQQIASYRQRVLQISAAQFDALAQIARISAKRPN